MLATDYDFPMKGTIALLSGDGAGWERGEGFFANLKRLRGREWEIELFSWESQVSRAMKTWAEQNGKYVPLDHWYAYITFVKEDPGSAGRRARTLPPAPYF